MKNGSGKLLLYDQNPGQKFTKVCISESHFTIKSLGKGKVPVVKKVDNKEFNDLFD